MVASIVPEEPTKDWSVENGHLFEYLVTLSTNVIFLGEVNRVVYCLDISPSVSSVVRIQNSFKCNSRKYKKNLVFLIFL